MKALDILKKLTYSEITRFCKHYNCDHPDCANEGKQIIARQRFEKALFEKLNLQQSGWIHSKTIVKIWKDANEIR